jgi:peptide chain release factor 1
LLDRLAQIEQRYIRIEEELANPETLSDVKRLQELGQERSDIETIVMLYRKYRDTEKQIADAEEMLKTETDDEMREMIKDELVTLKQSLEPQMTEMKIALLPTDPNDSKNVIMEIRAGTGGDEAGLFAADLYRMYTRYAQIKRWQVEIVDNNESSIGSIKEVVFEIKGKGAFSRLKYERGVHRVQRVPVTETSGRIHTSTATVAVLPEAEEVDVDIDPNDLRIDIFHSGGAGGQNVNKVATAVRITHNPTGLVVVCQDERSQLKNKQKAMAVLRSRLYEMEQAKKENAEAAERRSQVGTGERAEKIRTYNYPQDRVTDHRSGITLHNLPKIMEGYIDELIDSVAASEQARMLEESSL